MLYADLTVASIDVLTSRDFRRTLAGRFCHRFGPLEINHDSDLSIPLRLCGEHQSNPCLSACMRRSCWIDVTAVNGQRRQYVGWKGHSRAIEHDISRPWRFILLLGRQRRLGSAVVLQEIRLEGSGRQSPFWYGSCMESRRRTPVFCFMF